jgi:DNA-binding CsgD family transcriptional regulator
MDFFLLISTVLISILFGCAALSIAFFMQRKFELNYIKSYFYHQILIFLFGFYGLLGTIITHYLLIDIEIKGEILKQFFSFLPFIGVPFLIAAWYMFIKISFELIEKNLSLKFTIWFFITLLFTFLAFGFLVPYIDFFTVSQKEINTHVFLFFIAIELLTLVIVFANYFIFSKELKDYRKLKFVKNFAVINLVLYAISAYFLIKGEKDYLFISGYTMFYFSKDIIPLIYLNRYLNRNYIHPVNVVAENTRESFIEKFGISKRESEIVDEIICGRTNKEISDRLFISIQTVKDHIHNIYLKTEVKNRVQLTNLIRQFENQI